MSAYIVNAAHINALVTWAADHCTQHSRIKYYHGGQWRPIISDEKRIASVLYAENVRSVNARYSEATQADGFRFARRMKTSHQPYKPVEIIKACHGYEYQSCEAEGWEDSEAYAIIRAIKSAAVREIPGYDDADTWSIDDLITA